MPQNDTNLLPLMIATATTLAGSLVWLGGWYSTRRHTKTNEFAIPVALSDSPFAKELQVAVQLALKGKGSDRCAQNIYSMGVLLLLLFLFTCQLKNAFSIFPCAKF